MEDVHFLSDEAVHVHAATIGIGQPRWVSIDESDISLSRAQEVMSKNRFDVLPISTSSAVKEYYTTETWGDYGSVVRKDIDFSDLLFFKTPIRDLLRRFAEDDRAFFFLHSRHRVVGLVTAANLNCRAARVYLYSLLAEFEMELGRLIQGDLNDPDILDIVSPESKSVERYLEDREDGVDAPLIEYLTLSQLKKVLRDSDLYIHLGYPSKSQFKDSFGSLITARHSIAHPVRTVHGSEGSPDSLWKCVKTMEECLFHMKR